MSDNIRIMDDAPLEEGTSITGGQTFEEFANTMPDDASSGFGAVQPIPSSDDEGTQVINGDTPARKSIKMSKKMKAAMKKIQEKVCSFPILYFSNKAKIHPEWALDEDEKEIVTDSLSFVFDILNIEFQIEQLNLTLESIWWVIAYPICAIGMIFLSHKAVVDALHSEEGKDDDAK
jgi:hypothetical protein